MYDKKMDRMNKIELKHKYVVFLLFILVFFTSGTAQMANSHDWKSSSQILKQILEELADYEYGQDEEVLSRLREYIQTHKNDSSAREQCENQIGHFLESGASIAGKMAACRQLRLIGTYRSVTVLEKMLSQDETSDMARFALEKIPGTEPERALLQNLKNSTNKNKMGIISSLGQRGAVSAVPELSRLLDDPQVSIACASAAALGWIGGPEAVEVLSAALKVTKGELRFQAATSLLKCAEKFQALNQFQAAADLYNKMMELHFSTLVRQAALKGLLISNQNGAKSLLLDVLKGEDADLHAAAVGQIRSILKDSEIPEVLDLIPQLPGRSQIALFPVLSYYPSRQVLPAVIKATGDKDVGVRCAALEALNILGDASVVPLLAERAAQTKGREKRAAQLSLWNLKSPDVNQAIILELIHVSDLSIQRELIRCLGERRIEEGKPILFDFVSSSDPLIRQDAIRNLERIVRASDLPQLLDLLVQVEQESDKEALRKTLAASASFILNRNRRASAVIEKLKTVGGEKEHVDLLRILGVLGDNRTLPLLRQALKKTNSPLYDSAVRALTEWPDFTPRDDLLRIAQTAENLSLRVLALRSYIRMVGNERYRSPIGMVQSLKKGLDAAERPEERIQVLALLPRYPCAQALKLAESLLSDESVKAEASLAIKKILYDYFKNASYFRKY